MTIRGSSSLAERVFETTGVTTIDRATMSRFDSYLSHNKKSTHYRCLFLCVLVFTLYC